MLRPAVLVRAECGRRGWAKEVLPNPDLRLEVCKVTTPAAPLTLSPAWPLVKRIGRPPFWSCPPQPSENAKPHEQGLGFQNAAQEKDGG